MYLHGYRSVLCVLSLAISRTNPLEDYATDPHWRASALARERRELDLDVELSLLIVSSAFRLSRSIAVT